MRRSHSEHARTFLFTTLLFILSFTATLAESANIHGYRAHHAWRKRAPLDVFPRDQSTQSTTSQDLVPTITIASVLPSVLTTLTAPTSISLIPVPSLSTSSLSTSSSTSSSSQSSPNPTTSSSSSSSSTPSPTPAPSTSTTSTAIPTTSNGTPLSQSTLSQSSQSSSSAKPSTSTVAAVGATTLVVQTLATPVYSESLTSYPTGTTISSTPSSSSTSSSNSGFFSNTGAVAGTFTVAGLLGVAGIIGGGMLIARRRMSRKYEDDMEYLEKKPEPSVEPSQGQNFVLEDAEESSDFDHFGNSVEVTVPPAAHAYQQQDAYLTHGQTANMSEGYENQGYYPQQSYAPHEYGIAYPPMEPYAADDAYGGIDDAYAGMPNPFGEVTSELPAALRPSGQQSRTVNLPPAAYRPQDLPHNSIDSFYGSPAGPSHGHVM